MPGSIGTTNGALVAGDAADAVPRPRRRQIAGNLLSPPFWPLWTASVLLPLMLFALASVWTWQQKDAEEREEADRTVALLHQHTVRAFEVQDAVLAAVQGRSAKMSWQEIRTSRELWEFLTLLDTATPNTNRLGLIGPDGISAAISTAAFPSPPNSALDRDYFIAAQTTKTAVPLVGEPVIAPTNNQLVFPFARPRIGPDGQLDGGVIWTSFIIQGFVDTYRGVVATPDDVVMLVRKDGMVLARYPVPAKGVGLRLPMESPPMQAVLRASPPAASGQEADGLGRLGMSTGAGPIDGVHQQFVASRLATVPVAVIYGRAASAVRAGWSTQVAALAGVAGSASALMLALTWMVRRSALQGQQAAEHRAEAEAARADIEAALHQGQKREMLGQITAGVAHDFRNVVQAVQGGARLIARASDDRERVEQLTHLIEQAAGRGAELTNRLLELSVRRSAEGATPGLTDPSDAVGATARLMAPALGPDFLLRHSIAPGVPDRVTGDRAELEAALINLILNARDAMPKGGEIHIEVVNAQSPPGLRQGRYACIRVIDHGMGMDAATLARATEAFFTTKGPGRGTGLGLSTARAFAVTAGGSLALNSVPGEGTTVSLWLPAANSDGNPKPIEGQCGDLFERVMLSARTRGPVAQGG
jgi:signal transduction histidine kinase